MSDTSYFVVQLHAPQDSLDLVQGQLYRLGCLGLVEEDAVAEAILLKAYFPEQANHKPRTADMLKQLITAETGCLVQSAECIRLNASQFQPASFDPIQLAGDYWIVPPEDMRSQVEDERVLPQVIIIRPGMAFGTGRHETTQLCAQAMLAHIDKCSSLLDVGTGSGVLAILAQQLGVTQIAAVEISEDARCNARENFQLNSVTAIELCADITELKVRYDMVVANILAPTILQLKAELLSHLADSGVLILSGITIGEDDAIAEAFSNLQLIAKEELDGWYCFVFQNRS